MNQKEKSLCYQKFFQVNLFSCLKKKWAIHKNFPDFIKFLQNVGDKDIDWHLHNCSSRATYTSKAIDLMQPQI